MSDAVTLNVFTKAPVAGFVKTRLTPLLGEQGAAELHKRLTVHCLDNVALSTAYTTDLWCSPNTEDDFFKQLRSRYKLKLKRQRGEDLGDRLSYAIAQTLKKTKLAIVIGTDCPVLSQSVIELIIEKLNQDYDAAIIPAEDGGYVLLGVKVHDESLFSAISWGSSHVYTQTAERIAALGWKCYIHETLWDVDRPEDMGKLNKLDSWNVF